MIDRTNQWDNNRHTGFQTETIAKPYDLKDYVRIIDGFPKPNIRFYDISPLLLNTEAFTKAIKTLSIPFYYELDSIVCIEARGFLIGAPMAFNLNCGLIPVRKRGKLPAKTVSATYNLEYGTDTLEMHEDAIKPDQRILIVDDVLATGGTAKAIVDMVNKLQGNIIGCAFLIELTELNGRQKLEDIQVFSLMKF